MYLASWQKIKEALEAKKLSGFSPCLSPDALEEESGAGIQMHEYSLRLV